MAAAQPRASARRVRRDEQQARDRLFTRRLLEMRKRRWRCRSMERNAADPRQPVDSSWIRPQAPGLRGDRGPDGLTRFVSGRVLLGVGPLLVQDQVVARAGRAILITNALGRVGDAVRVLLVGLPAARERDDAVLADAA